MSSSLYKALSKSVRQSAAEDGRWVFSESAIVAEVVDPENRHRIKVIIPSIDEDLVYDDWISPATPFSFGDGFGSVFLPEVGSEVMITGVLGQKYNFVYHGAVYNEEAKAPDLGADTQGMKVPKNLSFIATLLFKLQSLENNIEILAGQLAKVQGENVEITAAQLAKTEAENIQSLASDENKMTGDTIKIEGGTFTFNADGSITVSSDASITITGDANVTIAANGVLRLHNRIVNKVGPAI